MIKNLILNQFVPSVFAKEITNPALKDKIGAGGTDAGIISAFLSTFVQLMFIIGIIAALVFFMIGVYEWITSGGDKTRVQEAQHRLRDVAIGLFLLFSTYAIMRLIGEIFDINLLQLAVPTVEELI